MVKSEASHALRDRAGSKVSISTFQGLGVAV